MTALFAALRKRGWVIREASERIPLLPDTLRERYPSVPREVASFLEGLEVCHNADESVWLLTPKDFRPTEPDAFRWNEYEQMALETVPGNAAAQAAIRAFWNDHLPIVLAVHSDYDYVAVRLVEPDAGSIVHGFAPEWEEPLRLARSFEEFVRSYTAEATSGNAEFPYSVFI